MRVLKFFLSCAVFCCVVGLASGALELFDRRPDGGARFSPHVSRPVAAWYAERSSEIAKSDPVVRLEASAGGFLRSR